MVLFCYSLFILEYNTRAIESTNMYILCAEERRENVFAVAIVPKDFRLYMKRMNE